MQEDWDGNLTICVEILPLFLILLPSARDIRVYSVLTLWIQRESAMHIPHDRGKQVNYFNGENYIALVHNHEVRQCQLYKGTSLSVCKNSWMKLGRTFFKYTSNELKEKRRRPKWRNCSFQGIGIHLSSQISNDTMYVSTSYKTFNQV